jgi:hypothetical protein
MGRPKRKDKPLRYNRAMRGEYTCPKCGRGFEEADEHWHRHHITARQDGGEDGVENIILLCSRCHAEWHSVEQCYSGTFGQWLQAPAAGQFLGIWYALDDAVTIGEIRNSWKWVQSFIAQANYGVYRDQALAQDISTANKRQEDAGQLALTV